MDPNDSSNLESPICIILLLLTPFLTLNKHYYEMLIISCKGSVERAKKIIDKMCTMRTEMAQFFKNYNVKTDFGNLHNKAYSILLPKLTDDHYRIEIIKLNDVILTSVDITNFYIMNLILLEYLKVHDYMNGLILILDYSDANLKDFLSKLNILELKQIISIYLEASAMRMRAIHVISPSTLINAFVTILKQILSPKLVGRLRAHKTVEEILDYIPKSVLPIEYGGEERSLKKIYAEWLDVLSSEEHMQHCREMNEAVTDETCRQGHQFNEQYAGLPGTFRRLNFD